MTLESQINNLLKKIEERKRIIPLQQDRDKAAGTANLRLLEGQLADLVAQLPIDIQENNMIEEKKTNSLIIPALIIGAVLLL